MIFPDRPFWITMKGFSVLRSSIQPLMTFFPSLFPFDLISFSHTHALNHIPTRAHTLHILFSSRFSIFLCTLGYIVKRWLGSFSTRHKYTKTNEKFLHIGWDTAKEKTLDKRQPPMDKVTNFLSNSVPSYMVLSDQSILGYNINLLYPVESSNQVYKYGLSILYPTWKQWP